MILPPTDLPFAFHSLLFFFPFSFPSLLSFFSIHLSPHPPPLHTSITMLSSQKINLSKIAAKAITPLVILPYLFLLPFSILCLALCHGNNSTATATATTSALTPLYTSANDYPYYLGTLSWMSVQWILHVISHGQIMTSYWTGMRTDSRPTTTSTTSTTQQ